MFYTGIGSRATPSDILKEMTELAAGLAMRKWTLRSGGAEGADQAFEAGAEREQGQLRIYRAHPAPLHCAYEYGGRKDYRGSAGWAWKLAEETHPRWDLCSPIARQLHARNVHQILGPTTTSIRSSFVICWTPDGAQTAGECNTRTGGTAMVIRIATQFSIPVINFAQVGGVQYAIDRMLKLFDA